MSELVSACRFPCYPGNYREFLLIPPEKSDQVPFSAPQINQLQRNSLGHGTGTFLEITGNFPCVSGNAARHGESPAKLRGYAFRR